MSAVLDEALRLATLGVAVFPVNVSVRPDGTKRHWPVRDWDASSTTDLEKIRGWFGDGCGFARALLAIDCRKSSLVVVDADGEEGMAAWRELNPPPAHVVRTPGGGAHYYYRADPERPVSIDSSGKVAHHVDIRGAGGYVIAAPSADARGAYRSVGPLDPGHLTTVPDVVVRRMSGRSSAPSAPSAPRGTADPFARPARTFTDEQAVDFARPVMDRLRTAPRGEINHRLNDAAVMLGHFVGEFWTTDEVTGWLVEAQREAWTASGGADDGDYSAAMATIASGLSAGARQPYARREVSAAALDDPDAALEDDLAFRRAVADEVRKQRVRDAARRELRSGDTPQVPAPTQLDELLAEPDEAQEWRIEGLLPSGGRVVLAAQRKAGKTTLVGNTVRALADGGELLGRFPVKQPDGQITVLDFEMSRATLRRWLRDQDVTNTDRITLWALRGKASTFDILDPAVRRQWAAQLRELGTAFLVVDCLRPILDALGLDESHESGRFLVALDALLDEAGIGECILVHHAGHNGERSRGDSRLRDWPDAEWRLVREGVDEPGQEPGPDARRYFAAEGRDVAVAESLLEFDQPTRHLSLVGGNRRETKADDLIPAVMSVIRETPPGGAAGWSQRAVESAMDGLGHGRNLTRTALKRAVLLGYAVVVSGPRRAALHLPSQSSAPVRQTAPSALAQTRSECASAPLGGALHSLTPEAGSEGSAPVAHSSPAADPCHCGRPASMHSRGQWSVDPCPTCGRRWHKFGAGGRSACPSCQPEAGTS